jgi:predicted ATPase/class 3 adenylate cyclase
VTQELDAPALPTGTVTFLFTDIEGSTKLLQELGKRYAALLGEHRELIVRAAEAHGGQQIGSEGDAIFLAFADASSGISAAVDAQRALGTHQWPDGRDVRVRMGIHTGEAILTGDGYVGLSLHQVARITAAGHGGQVLVSNATRTLVADALPEGVAFKDLGEHRLKDLARPERLAELLIPGLERAHPPLRTLDIRRNNLPLQLTTFVGRRDLETARALFGSTRLLTLTGPGGTGKTRMALQLAAEVAHEFTDGVFFVALDSIFDPTLVPSAIAESLQIDSGTDPPLERVIATLRDRTLLLVLDNFEQVLEGGAALVTRILREAPNVKILVTSRIVLRASGEQEFAVPPLGLPTDGSMPTLEDATRSEAVMLFVERAMAVQPSFVLTGANAPLIGDIVGRLDGLPLAIELAAARTRVLPLDTLRARLDDRLSILTGGARDLPARQQTLRGAIDWSFDLLDEPDRRLFERFAVFTGGACLSEAEVICGPASELGREPLDGLASLVEKSLVRSVPGNESEPRFAMLATIREYALVRLDANAEAEAVRRRHAEAYLDLAERSGPHVTGTESRRWLDRIQLDHDNIRAALDWAVDRDEAGLGLRMVAATWRFWQIRGHLHEAQARIAAVLDLLSAAEQPADVLSRGYGAAGSVAYWRGEFAEMRTHYRTALDEAHRSDDRATLAEALYNFAFSFGVGMDMEISRPYVEESLAIYRELGDLRGIAATSWALGVGYTMAGYRAKARPFLAESLTGYRKLADSFGIGWALHELGFVEILDHQADAAVPHLREALQLFADTRDLSALVIVLGDFAEVANQHGDRERYWRLLGASDALRKQTGADLGVASAQSTGLDVPDHPPDDDPSAQRAWAEGHRLTVDEAIEYTLEQPAG